MVSYLNTKQGEIFDVVNKWTRDYLKKYNLKTKRKVELMHLFVTEITRIG